MEEAMSTCTHGFVAVNSTRAKYANGRLCLFHDTRLHAAGVAAKNDVGMRLHEERVLHVASRMVVSKVQTAVNVPVVLHLRAFCQGETKAAEDIDDFILDNRQGMTRAERNGIRCAREVDRRSTCDRALSGTLLQGVYLLLSEVLQLVNLHAHLFLQFGGNTPEVIHQLRNLTFFAQVFDAKSLCLLSILCLKRRDFLHQLFYFLYHKKPIFCVFACKVINKLWIKD